MEGQELFWFHTRQSLLEEWGYRPGMWHLVKRSRISIVIVGITAEGVARRNANNQLSELSDTRITLALVDLELCEFIGPFPIDALPRPAQLDFLRERRDTALTALKRSPAKPHRRVNCATAEHLDTFHPLVS